MRALKFAWRHLRRELGYGELTTLAAALVLAVAALGAVATLSLRVEQALVAGASELLGGDLGVTMRAPLPDELVAEAGRLGLEASSSAAFPSVLFANEQSALCDVRAVDAAYPLRGQLKLRDAEGRETVSHGPRAGEVYLEHSALVALGLKVGDSLTLGARPVKVAAEIARVPDGNQLFALAPRALMALPDAQASGLLGPGSRVTYRLMVAGEAAPLAQYGAWLDEHRPDGAELITRERSQQSLKRAFDRGAAFLRLAALLAALLAGVAIALAAQRYAQRKIDEVALLRCLGASRREVLSNLVSILALLGIPAALFGAVLGIALQAAVFALARELLPGAPPAVPFGPSAAAFAIGLAVLFGFALPPLLRLSEVSPVRVFQRAVTMKLRRFDGLYLLPFALSLGLIYLESESWTLASVLSIGLFGVALVTVALGYALLFGVARVARLLPGALRFGLANLVRRRRSSLIQATALALSLTALDLLAVVGPSLLANWRAELPPDTPNYFLLNLQPDQRDAVAARLSRLGGTNLNTLPMAVGKLVAIDGKPPRAPDDGGEGEGRRGGDEIRLSWSEALPEANKLIEGTWPGAGGSTPELSVEKLWRDRFHLKLGDSVTLRVAEQEITARVTSFREVEWDSFRVNFFLLLDPASARGLPHSVLASFHLEPGHAAELGSLTREFPNLSLIDLNALIERVREIIGRVSAAVMWVLGFSLLAGLLVLAAALATSADERRFEAALLRTLGAGRAELGSAVLGEFALLGVLAGSIAALGAGGTGYLLAERVFKIGYEPPLAELSLAILVSAVVVAVAGWLGTRRIARASPLLVLRRA